MKVEPIVLLWWHEPIFPHNVATWAHFFQEEKPITPFTTAFFFVVRVQILAKFFFNGYNIGCLSWYHGIQKSVYYRPMRHQNMGALHDSIPLICEIQCLCEHIHWQHADVLNICKLCYPNIHYDYYYLCDLQNLGGPIKKPCARSSLQEEYGWVVRLVTLFGI